jgi:misacylated tRNA(Ala) deacylase
MTKLLYQRDSYIQTFDAKVTQIDHENHAIALDQSAFYPGGGGQPADQGTLRNDGQTFVVTKAKKSGRRFFTLYQMSNH